MYRHYAAQTISGEELDELIESAEQAYESSGWRAGDVFVVAEDEDGQTDEDLDDHLWNLLETVGDQDGPSERSTPDVDPREILSAVDTCGLMLGEVYNAPNRADKVIKVSDDALTSATAWAILETLPMGAVSLGSDR